jgi:hypothetical protein
MHQFIEGSEETGLGLGDRLHSSPWCTDSIGGLDPRLHFLGGLDHRVAAHPRGRGHQRLGSLSAHLGEGTHHRSALALIEVRQGDLEESRERFDVDLHAVIVARAC